MPFIGEHYFDYSRSFAGVSVYLDRLFGAHRQVQTGDNSISGTALTGAFGGGRNYQIVHYEDALGNALEQRVFDTVAQSSDTSQQTEPTPDGFLGGTTLVFADIERATSEAASKNGGQFIQFNGLPAMINAYGARPEHVYTPPGTIYVASTIDGLNQAAENDYLGQRARIDAIRLQDFTSIDIVSWSNGAELSPEYHLRYQSRLVDGTIGDIAHGDGRFMQMNGTSGSVAPDPSGSGNPTVTQSWIGDADVLEIVLTDKADEIYGGSITVAPLDSERTEVFAGAGDDLIEITINPYARSDGASPRRLNAFGEAGNDTIAVATQVDRFVELSGGAGNDYIRFSAENHASLVYTLGRVDVYGGADDDTLWIQGFSQEAQGVASQNYIDGGPGNDTIRFDRHVDTVLGGDGNDVITSDELIPSGLEQITGSVVSGQSGNDELRGGIGADTVFGGIGDDTLFATPGIDILDGGDGNDTYRIDAHSYTQKSYEVIGERWEMTSQTHRSDTLIRDTGGTVSLSLPAAFGAPQFLLNGDDLTVLAGTLQDHRSVVVTIENFRPNALNWSVFAPGPGAADQDPLVQVDMSSMVDVASLSSLDGLDVFTSMFLRDANDTWLGDWFTDGFFSNWAGSTAADAVSTGGGRDFIDTGGGNDTIDAGDGDDFIFGGDGVLDYIKAGNGNDHVRGGQTSADLRDEVDAGNGDDYVDTGYGNDQAFGGAGNDTLIGGFGADFLIGQGDNDMLSGGALSDVLYGGDGDDFLNGGFGFDRILSGTGADRIFHLGIPDHGTDWVQDYDAGDGDVLQLGQFATRDQFQVNFAETAHAGKDGVQEAFVIYRPTGQILWALIDGEEQAEINVMLNGIAYDVLN